MKHYFGDAKELGISTQEIGALESIVMAVSAGRVNAQFREARMRTKPAEKTDGEDS